jgi:hypothetical protein
MNINQMALTINKTLKLIFYSQAERLWTPHKLNSFGPAQAFINTAFSGKCHGIESLDIYVTKYPLYHEENIVYSTLIHAGEEIGSFSIHDGENFIPFQVNADAPIIVVNGKQDGDGLLLSIVHEISHLLDEEPNDSKHGYMDSPREQRARAAEVAFLRWMGVEKQQAVSVMQARYEDAADMQM